MALMKTLASRRFQRRLNTVLIVIVVLLAAMVSTRYKIEADWTYGNRNTLTEGSRRQLAAMPDAIRVLVFDYPNSETRGEVQALVARYQRVKKNLSLEFIDPGAEPIKARSHKISRAGVAVLEYQGRHETLEQLGEAEIAASLQRLADAGERYVLFLQGHGERSITPGPGATQYDLTLLAEALAEKGLKVLPLNLLTTPKIPDNTSALVIASATQALLDGEIATIRAYVEAGGNLLWLTDPDYPAGLEPLAQSLGVHWLNGTVIFANYAAVGSPSPAVFLTASYPPNPITGTSAGQFAKITSFPLARALEFDTPALPKVAGWTYAPIIETQADAWLETGSIDGEVAFDKDVDRRGPLTIGLSMSRELPAAGEQAKRNQRIALFGDGDFLSDLMLERDGNKALAVALLQWLSSRDALIDVDVPRAPDIALNLPPWAFWLAGAGFTAIIPLLLLGFGIGRWLIRRRQ